MQGLFCKKHNFPKKIVRCNQFSANFPPSLPSNCTIPNVKELCLRMKNGDSTLCALKNYGIIP